MKAPARNRVLMLLENSTYPIDPRVRQEARTLSEAGYQVSVICPRMARQPWYESSNGISIFRYPPLRAQGFLGYVLEYSYSLIAMFILSLVVWAYSGFDVIHAANPPDSAVFIALFYKLFGKRFVFDHHDIAPEMYRVRYSHKGSQLVYRVLIWLEKTSCRFADHVIAANQSHKNVEMQRGHVPENQITIVRNGPALDCLNLVDPGACQGNREKVILGYIGVIGPQDGLDYLLRALQLLNTVLQRNDFSCIIIGEGSALAKIKMLAKQLDILPYVSFTGFLPQMDALKRLSAVDICVDPDPSNIYNDHCTMIKLMEYMALGKPIVAFDLPEHHVTAGNAALYAHPNEELDFARQIMILMDDQQRREQMGKIGLKRVENELAWSYQARNLLDAYASVRNTSVI